MDSDHLIKTIAAQMDASKMGWQQLVDVFAATAQAAALYVPDGVAYRTLTVKQIPIELFAPPRAQGFVLFLHGGNYLLPSCDVYRRIAEDMALKSHKTVVMVDYAIAPFAYPDALSEVFTVWEWLYAQDDRVCFVGDGSGANLALQLAFLLREKKVRMPKALVLLSPQTDMTCSGISYYDNFFLDVIYGKKQLNGQDIPDAFKSSELWAYCKDEDLASPEISPLFATLEGLPPCFITVGSHEVVLSDALRFAEKALSAGVEVHLTVGEGLFYAYPYFYRRLPEARAVFGAFCTFLQAK